ncbi:MAG: bifunctional protein-serine/threonine kinase/phosphatase, partial [Gammaproteobacteria bacterium]|nr:bifunctional protein-serine/threonine kinase/phosphatase [Gammaproteobacteria bacterium]
IKERNEDFYGALIPTDEVLETKGISCVIADGMGSCEYAAEASEQCVKSFINDYYSTPETWSVKNSAGKVLTAVNSWLLSQSKNDVGHGMVTTFSGLILKSTTAYLLHVGDSRIYRLRGHDFEQLTNDHRIKVNKTDSYLSRAMGIDHLLDIDFKTVSIQAGDLFLMTTDGIHDYLSSTQIKNYLLQQKGTLDQQAKALVDAALEAKSHDNVTAQLVFIDDLPTQDENEVFSRLTKLPFPPHLGPGMTIDGYEITEEIYASTTAQLYKVRDKESGETFVLKTPSVNFEDDPAYIERFYMEEWAGKRVDSQLVLKIYELKRPRNFLYMIMEYIEGITLREWIQQNHTPDIDDVIELTEKICAGVRVLHRMDMLHQDLKPENIMITPNQGIKIIDFGSVKIAGISEISTPVERAELLGTKNYTAPEYLQGIRTDERGDLFSVGVMVYEMFTQNLPYGEKMGRNITYKQMNKLKYRSALEFNPMIPLWMDGAIERSVKLEVKTRYEVFSEFLFDLKKPNPLFQNRSVPFIEKDPSGIWKVVAALLLVSNLFLIFKLLRC